MDGVERFFQALIEIISYQGNPKNLFLIGAFFFISIGQSFSALSTLVDKDFVVYESTLELQDRVPLIKFDLKNKEQCEQEYPAEFQTPCKKIKYQNEAIQYLEERIIKFATISVAACFILFLLSTWGWLIQINKANIFSKKLDNAYLFLISTFIVSLPLIVILFCLTK